MPGPVSDSSPGPSSDPHPPIPIEAAELLCLEFGYEQVVIVARSPEKDTEAVTTFGLGDDNSRAAMHMGERFQRDIMGWLPQSYGIIATQWALRKVLAPGRYE